MKINNSQVFKKSALCLALSSALAIPTFSYAEKMSEKVVDEGIERIQVTASRRASTVQEAPLNITALDGDVMKDQKITELADVARWVPGLSVVDQGGREGSPIIVRGLNTNSAGPESESGTVATYIGEIPLVVDMKIIDVERIEILIGPQGTLYGAGTLGGAIRYLPNKPILDETSGSLYGDIFSLSESDDTGGEAGFVFNTPLIDDELAVRFALIIWMILAMWITTMLCVKAAFHYLIQIGLTLMPLTLTSNSLKTLITSKQPQPKPCFAGSQMIALMPPYLTFIKSKMLVVALSFMAIV